MEFKLNEEAEEKTEETGTESGADADGYYHLPQSDNTVTRVSADTNTKTKKVHIPGFVIVLVVAVVVALILTNIPWNRKTALEPYFRLPQAELEETLGVKMTENPEGPSYLSIPNRDHTGFQVYSGPKKDIGVIYYNGKQAGICFDGKKYSAYGITIGDSESHLLTKAEETKVLAGEGSTGYKYTYYFSKLDDIGQRGSTAEYFLGVDGSVLVLVINDTSNRVVNIIYYYDSTRILQDIDRIL